MESADTQRFGQRFMQVVIALGVASVLLSLYRLPSAQLGLPLLFLALTIVHLDARFSHITLRGRKVAPAVDALLFLAMLLFDGEAAILLAAVVALCAALRAGRNGINVFFSAAVKVFAAFLVVWTLRLNFGSLAEISEQNPSLATLNAVCMALLVNSIARASITAIGEAYKINQRVWLTWGHQFLWAAATYFAGAVAACLVATLVGFTGMENFIAVAAILSVADFAYRAYRRNPELCVPDTKLVERNASASKESEERFRSAFDYAAIGMALVSSEGRWLQVNRSLCEIVGYTEPELLATDFLTITHPDDLGTAMTNIGMLLKGNVPTYQMEKRYMHKQGHEVWVNWSVSLARDAMSKSVHLIFQIQDITNRKVAEQQLHHDAFHDALTGLPNRALFMDHLRLAIARAKRNSTQMYAVLYLDLDRFKVINDSLGHMVGDQLLVGIARRLEECLRPGDTVARLGGDEFTVLIEDIKAENEAIYVAERIQKELRLPFNLSGREVFTTVSIGIAPSSSNYERAEDILRDADTAMYRAKSAGKARHEIFDTAMHARAMNLLQLETDLRRAVEREEFFVQYQPIVDLENFSLRGFEALVRWRHPERGFISPIDFIPVAEETGLIIPLGEWVLRESCKQMQRWQKMFPSDPLMFISVNLSGKQFAQHDLINEVAYILNETKIDPHSLKLEITESVVMENIETATEMLKQLRALGVQLSIDDFGTGYSSLSYLHRFPIDTLKIDRSFVTCMAENNENMEIVRTIIMLAQNLGMDVVAEGVETNEQLSLLRKLGCENGQGYFFSKPVYQEGAEKIISDTYLSQMPAVNLNNSNQNKKVLYVS
ncbi:MAG TPA: EAL domain-containing protein [Pyrinomonadaceae bacterium]|jgi:diguanylate cyclase (GGDEF)-like protein/PAS domain S-box-containing protein|nr:EAL domain-containing protein [Pyrinomonadaceae bacterium]